ncbi:MAG: hypothetical protein V3V31_00395 [Methylococcales bacterium]
MPRTDKKTSKMGGYLLRVALEPVQDLDQGMQRKAKVDEKAQHTGRI